MADEKAMETRRKFVGPDEITEYFIDTPSAKDIREADWQYSKSFTRCLSEDIPTAAEMRDILKRRGIIGPEFEKRSAELTDILNGKVVELESAAEMLEKERLAIQVAEAREDLFQWNQRLNGPMSNTCEQIADDARLEFLTSSMVFKEDGNRFWESYDAFLEEENQALNMKARFEVMLYIQGLDSNFLDETPEARALKEIEEEILVKAQEAIDAARALEEEEVKKEEAKKKVTRTRKPAAKKTAAKKPATRKKTSTTKPKKEDTE